MKDAFAVPHVAALAGIVDKGGIVFEPGREMSAEAPARSALPSNTSAWRCLPSWPGYQACNTAATLPSHGIATGPPLGSTTMVLG